MSENFNELKRLFDAQVTVIEQEHINRAVKRFQVADEDALRRKHPALAEDTKLKARHQAVSTTLAMLLDGDAISTAKTRLKAAVAYLEDMHKVDAASIQKLLLTN